MLVFLCLRRMSGSLGTSSRKGSTRKSTLGSGSVDRN